MGVILKYQVDFPDPDVGFKVSNELFSGNFIIDADIKAEMARGTVGSQFEVKLSDLPEAEANKLYQRVQTSKLGNVVIKLGYMDGEFEEVMSGLYSKVVIAVEGDKLVTLITGLETGTHALQYTRFQKNLDGRKTIEAAVQALLKDATIFEGDIDRDPILEKISKEVQDITLRGENLMEILNEIAEMENAELLINDKKVRIGKPITNDKYEPGAFDRDANLAVFKPFVKNIPGEEGDNVLEKLPAKKALGFKFIIAGDPKLRPAQRVFAKVKIGNDSYEDRTNEFRIHSLVHSLSVNSGYVCEGIAFKICTDDNCRRQENAIGQRNAEEIVQSFSQRIKAEQRQRPSIEVGKVKQYTPGESGDAKHRSTLYFGQRFDKTETQPSIRAEVETDEHQLLRNKAMVSPFAWHKCGLVVPVYPGMKALLNHNLNLPSDALVTGFLWSDKPPLEPPKNKVGDWWLCLPIDFDSSNPPTDSTKAANDLIANNGKRVIEVKGLKITIGEDKLPSVGARPSEGEDNEFLIEHKSGTRFKIAANGSLSIEASNISIKGDVTIEGNVEIK